MTRGSLDPRSTNHKEGLSSVSDRDRTRFAPRLHCRAQPDLFRRIGHCLLLAIPLKLEPGLRLDAKSVPPGNLGGRFQNCSEGQGKLPDEVINRRERYFYQC